MLIVPGVAGGVAEGTMRIGPVRSLNLFAAHEGSF